MKRPVLVAMLIAAVALGASRGAVANPALYPVNLQVDGGEGSWHSDGRFQLTWALPPIAEDLPVSAVGYRVHDEAGNVVIPLTRLEGPTTRVGFRVPSRPGIYRASLWLEGPEGERGFPRNVELRYDDTRPGAVQPLVPEGWIAASVPVAIAVQAPPDPSPISGIRGYAVSVDRGGPSWPCAARSRCEETEIDLPGDDADRVLSLGTLPEGVHTVRVVAVSGAGVPSSEPGTALVRVDTTPPAVALAGLPEGWVDGPVRILATAADPISGMASAGPNGPYTALAVDGGVPRAELGDSASVTITGDGIHRVDAYARDAAGNVDSTRPRMASVAIDESPPQVAFAAQQDPGEPERIEAALGDALSGVDPSRGSIGVREAGSSQAWQPLRTTAAGGRLCARWDSDSYPEGIYEFRAIGYDRAGNSAATNQRQNHTRMVLTNPLKSQVRLQAGLKRRMQPSARVPYGRGLVYYGQVRAAGGSPLAGIPVQIVESFEPGATAGVRSSQLVTATDGSFSIRLPPGPSRRVEAKLSGTRILGAAQSAQARLEVTAAVAMRASTATARVGGAPVVFSGRVGGRGALLPRGGLAVELQFRVPGGEWAEFRTVQTDRSGRFRYRYAFSDDDSRGVRFLFRARINGGDWPYEPAASKAVSVTGR